ncbi:CocE/NonD family hydrolase [Aestuariivirga sp. YIM B02566]|uniref:CocE/NonD family hydrolase n=1 Tax=Taklimakanibacter albus TaxID=2800327 RepID=A0ACC5R6K4_9HYPH|nr:CocE/NonD family hydrolase [Aestuariivirga sp. YIM B02566]MBK1868203.1 CocE/NonD family hydrolase [Aestuariivirga sp. YIM B02566]
MADIRTEFPYAVEVVDPLWITLADGTRIATTLWKPKTKDKVPLVVEMVPYRRRDGTVFRDVEIQAYWAGFGVAVCRVDIRGAGDSDGLLADEYLPREQEDACEIIAHLSAEAWCNGNVGMVGISWGGFNSLQVAARRPPALKAIITLCSTDDRYADDVHYMGGALITEDEMWSNFMLVKNAMPPDPQIVGDAWRDMWLKRLEANTSWSEHWLRHQCRDAYWKQGSVCEDFSKIDCAVLAVCGWEDSYSNSVARLLEGLSSPKRAIMGPWTHAFPCRGNPGPQIGYLQEALRWWKYWLAGEATGIMDEPLYRVFVIEEERPRSYYETHRGHWVAEEAWPSPRIDWQTRYLNPIGLDREAKTGAERSVRSPATAGTDCGRWGGYGGTSPDLAIDQRREDGQALCFDTEPLAEAITLLGAPEIELELTVDVPKVNLAARLCDVYPDGTSALMTYGVLNLSHRDSHEFPEDCPVGKPFKVKLKLNDFAREIPAGHRIRLALATQHWFVLWPQPTLATATIRTGLSTIRLPVRPAGPRDTSVRFEPAEIAPPVPSTDITAGAVTKTVEDDLGSGIRTIKLRSDGGTQSIDDRGIVTSSWNNDTFFIHPDDPLSAKLVTEYAWAIRSGPSDMEAKSRTELTADAGNFYLTWQIEAREKGRVIHSKGATRTIKRDFC